ncbi:MAG: hypothetical protein UU20_C0049G0015 [Parcubacteria group bacterium GW2011_GWE2_40_8]|nr:MAG: hypothetical protein UU20_C0049G0015 [Parcubacteria group bacterium GW2011_GWE2_40_8]
MLFFMEMEFYDFKRYNIINEYAFEKNRTSRF